MIMTNDVCLSGLGGCSVVRAEGESELGFCLLRGPARADYGLPKESD